MKPPIIIQIHHPEKKIQKRWFRKNIVSYVYRWENGTHRNFSEKTSAQLQEHFSSHPPSVGDVVFLTTSYKIIKCFWNMNHDSYEIWWTPVMGHSVTPVEVSENNT